jgi:hypothetical protein
MRVCSGANLKSAAATCGESSRCGAFAAGLHRMLSGERRHLPRMQAQGHWSIPGRESTGARIAPAKHRTRTPAPQGRRALVPKGCSRPCWASYPAEMVVFFLQSNSLGRRYGLATPPNRLLSSYASVACPSPSYRSRGSLEDRLAFRLMDLRCPDLRKPRSRSCVERSPYRGSGLEILATALK